MSRSTRLFEIIQFLRRAEAPLTAQRIAECLEVTKRTVYRDIAALQAMRVPIDGQAGVGYVMRPGYDLPPVNFSDEEAEAITVGLALLGRTGDTDLQAAARRAADKISDVRTSAQRGGRGSPALYASAWHDLPTSGIPLTLLRRAIRQADVLSLSYRSEQGAPSERAILPLALIYYVDAVVLAAWCNLRADFRHFRVDRMISCAGTGERLPTHAETLRRQWRTQRSLD